MIVAASLTTIEMIRIKTIRMLEVVCDLFFVEEIVTIFVAYTISGVIEKITAYALANSIVILNENNERQFKRALTNS